MCNDPMSYADRQDALTVARTKVIRQARKISEWHKGAFEGDEKCPCRVCKSVRELERLEAVVNWQSAPEKEPRND